MAALDPPTVADVTSIADALIARIRRGQREISDERQAFRAFQKLVATVDTRDVADASAGGLVLQTQGTPGLDQVRTAYESTVMAVPHYADEYGDTYADSVVAEFGPDIGPVLVDGHCLTDQLKQAVLASADHCQDERERFFHSLKTK